MSGSLFHLALTLWRCKWGLIRLGIAVVLLWSLVSDNPSRLARVQFKSLPGIDYVAEVRSLRAQKRYAEAQMVADAGLADLSGAQREALLSERQSVRAEQESVVRRGKELLRGALVGEGDSVEALIGAVAADMLIVGDIRDLLIQGGRLAVDGDSDELILALSAVGVLTTVMPEVDWIAAFLKIAKKAGSLSKRMVETLVRVIRRSMATGRYADLCRVFGSFQVLVEKSTPAGALRLLRHIDDTNGVEAVAGFLRRQPSGAFALHVAGKEGVEIVKSSARGAEEALVLAARKGEHGTAWLRTGGSRLFRPHPIVGLLKGLRKGTIQRAISRIAAEYDPWGWLVIPACAGWVFLEAAWLWRRWFRSRRAPLGAQMT
ncbi:MAG TPA: hypothetical protein VKU82_02100 [Planctomycetaceae bacterium]|nr:hypothetical protein [Planctomycetaceae bacterium]